MSSVPEVAERIRNIETSAESDATSRRSPPHEDGDVCPRVVDVVFREVGSSAYTVHSDLSGAKEKLLIYLGSLDVDGHHVLGAEPALRHLDYDRFDVSGFFPDPDGRDRLKSAARRTQGRVHPRFGAYSARPYRVAAEQRRMTVGLPDRGREPERFWGDEWRRMFGMSQFDHVVDLSGYGTFCPFLFGAAAGSEKSLWLHSDLHGGVAAGDRGHEAPQGATQRCVQHVLLLRPPGLGLRRARAGELEEAGRFATPEKFTLASNTIDHQRVLTMAGLERTGGPCHGEPCRVDTEHLSSTVASPLEHFEPRGHRREPGPAPDGLVPERAGRHARSWPSDRLSPEKNHDRLMRAFAQVHERHPETRLVILGDGRLRPEVSALCRNSVCGVVSLAGHVDNPYASWWSATASCSRATTKANRWSCSRQGPWVSLSSPPRFPSVAGSVPEGAGLIVEQNVDALAEGMEQVLTGDVPSQRLDWAAYNGDAMRQSTLPSAPTEPQVTSGPVIVHHARGGLPVLVGAEPAAERPR